MLLKWDVENPYTMHLKVEADLIDVLGHVNNTEYLKWMELVAWSHCRDLGMNFNKWQQLGYAWVARHTEIDYLIPALENDIIQAGTWISENDRRISMIRNYQLIRESDGKTLARGSTRWICVSLKSGKISRMPAEFLNSFPVTKV